MRRIGKPKHLVSALQDMDSFVAPRLELEQYATPPEIAAAILEQIVEDMDGDLSNCMVADLGCGTGVLLVGSALMGASFVLGLDIDPVALAICSRNIDQKGLGPSCGLIQVDLRSYKGGNLPDRLHGQFDIVVTNPPFGTKNSEGADLDFLEAGLLLAKPAGGRLYSLHKSSTRQFLLKWAGKRKNPNETVRAECRAQLRWNLNRSYGHHRQKSVDILVDLFCFERRQCC